MGLLIDGTISACLLGLLVFLVAKEPTQTLSRDLLLLLSASYLGLLFACVYRVRDRLLLF